MPIAIAFSVNSDTILLCQKDVVNAIEKNEYFLKYLVLTLPSYTN